MKDTTQQFADQSSQDKTQGNSQPQGQIPQALAAGASAVTEVASTLAGTVSSVTSVVLEPIDAIEKVVQEAEESVINTVERHLEEVCKVVNEVAKIHNTVHDTVTGIRRLGEDVRKSFEELVRVPQAREVVNKLREPFQKSVKELRSTVDEVAKIARGLGHEAAEQIQTITHAALDTVNFVNQVVNFDLTTFSPAALVFNGLNIVCSLFGGRRARSEANSAAAMSAIFGMLQRIDVKLNEILVKQEEIKTAIQYLAMAQAFGFARVFEGQKYILSTLEAFAQRHTEDTRVVIGLLGRINWDIEWVKQKLAWLGVEGDAKVIREHASLISDGDQNSLRDGYKEYYGIFVKYLTHRNLTTENARAPLTQVLSEGFHGSSYGSVQRLAREINPFQGLQMTRMAGNGDCLYNAIGKHLKLSAHALRTEVADYLAAHPEEFKEVIAASGHSREDYIQGVRDNAWGDHIEIEVIQRLYSRPIIILRPDDNPRMPENLSELREVPIFVFYNGQDHYDGFEVEGEPQAILDNIQVKLRQSRRVFYSTAIQEQCESLAQLHDQCPNFFLWYFSANSYLIFLQKLYGGQEKTMVIKSELQTLARFIEQGLLLRRLESIAREPGRLAAAMYDHFKAVENVVQVLGELEASLIKEASDKMNTAHAYQLHAWYDQAPGSHTSYADELRKFKPSNLEGFCHNRHYHHTNAGHTDESNRPGLAIDNSYSSVYKNIESTLKVSRDKMIKEAESAHLIELVQSPNSIRLYQTSDISHLGIPTYMRAAIDLDALPLPLSKRLRGHIFRALPNEAKELLAANLGWLDAIYRIKDNRFTLEINYVDASGKSITLINCEWDCTQKSIINDKCREYFRNHYKVCSVYSTKEWIFWWWCGGTYTSSLESFGHARLTPPWFHHGSEFFENYWPVATENKGICHAIEDGALPEMKQVITDEGRAYLIDQLQKKKQSLHQAVMNNLVVQCSVGGDNKALNAAIERLNDSFSILYALLRQAFGLVSEETFIRVFFHDGIPFNRESLIRWLELKKEEEVGQIHSLTEAMAQEVSGESRSSIKRDFSRLAALIFELYKKGYHQKSCFNPLLAESLKEMRDFYQAHWRKAENENEYCPGAILDAQQNVLIKSTLRMLAVHPDNATIILKSIREEFPPGEMRDALMQSLEDGVRRRFELSVTTREGEYIGNSLTTLIRYDDPQKYLIKFKERQSAVRPIETEKSLELSDLPPLEEEMKYDPEAFLAHLTYLFGSEPLQLLSVQDEVRVLPATSAVAAANSRFFSRQGASSRAASSSGAGVVQPTLSNSVFDNLCFEKIPGDGDCLFNAIGIYLGKNPKEMRELVAHYLEEHPDEFKEVIAASGASREEYIRQIRDTKEWGDHLEIEIIQRITGRPIIILTPNANPILPGNLKDYGGEPIFVYYNGRDHYDGFTVKLGTDVRNLFLDILTQIDQGKLLPYYPVTQHIERSQRALTM